MKALGVAMVLMAALVVAGCGEQRVVELDKLLERSGLMYEINAEEPFTGTAVSYWPNGQKREEAEVRDGKLLSYKRWDEDGNLIEGR